MSVAIYGLLTNRTEAAAKKKGSIQSESGLLIAPELPKNNIGGKTLGFFNIPIKTKKQELRIKLYNKTNHTVHLKVRVVDAVTLDDGKPNYTGSKNINPKLLQQPGSQYIKTIQKMALAKQSDRWLDIKVSSFSQKFRGRKATAIVIETDDADQNANSSVSNRYVYAVGLTLNGTKIKKNQYHKLKIQTIKTRVLQKKAFVSVGLSNPDPMYLKNINLDIKLVNKKYKFFKYQYKKQGIEVTPNSSFLANVPLKGMRLVPGIYQMTVKSKSDQYYTVLNRTVRITKHDAYLINSKNEAWLRNRNILVVFIIIVIILIIIITIWYRRQAKVTNDYKHD